MDIKAELISTLVGLKPTSFKDCLWLVLYFFIASYTYYTFKCISDCIWLRRFKGPLALPIIGNLYTPEAVTILKFLSTLKKKYGRVFAFFMFTRPYIVICEPEIVNQILYNTSKFPKGEDYDVFAIPFGNGLVTAEETRHKRDKSLFHRFFHRDNIMKFVKVMNQLVGQSMNPKDGTKNINLKHLDEVAVTGESIDIENFFAVLAMRTFSKFSMSWEFKSLQRESEVCSEISKGSYCVGASIIHNWMPRILFNMMPEVRYIKKERKKLWDLDFKPLVETRRSLMAAADQEISKMSSEEEKKAHYSKRVPDDMLTAMLNDDVNKNDKDIMDHIVTLLSAGHDTTAYFSSYFMYCMGDKNHAHIQKRLYEEIRQKMEDKIVAENLGDNYDEEKIKAFEFEDTYVSEDDFMHKDLGMKYLNACMQETLRLYAIIPQVTRTVLKDEDVKIEGSSEPIRLPKGVNLFIPMFLINRDPDIWKEPSVFNPDRFLEVSDSKASMWNFTAKKYGYFPFGHGARVCIGQTLAQVESGVFICRLLLRYEVLEDEKFKPFIMSGISLTTNNGIHVKLKRRPVTTDADRDQIRRRIREQNEKDGYTSTRK